MFIVCSHLSVAGSFYQSHNIGSKYLRIAQMVSLHWYVTGSSLQPQRPAADYVRCLIS